MQKFLRSALSHPQFGLAAIILLLGVIMAKFSGTHEVGGRIVSNFLNASSVTQVLIDSSGFAIMAVGMTVVIISGGIDLSVGSICALAGVTMAMVFRAHPVAGPMIVPLGLAICLGIGLICGWLNGLMASRLGVHPFIITLGTMWIYRGISLVISGAASIGTPMNLIEFTKTKFFGDLFLVPVIAMVLVAILGSSYLNRRVAGRHVFALGGNAEAARYAGLPVKRITTRVYILTGLCAGLAAFLGASFYGSASCNDANGYELYVVASAVVGGASLIGGRGSAFGAMLGAILIVLMRQSIRTFGFDQNYEWIIVGVAIIVAVVLDRYGINLVRKQSPARV